MVTRKPLKKVAKLAHFLNAKTSLDFFKGNKKLHSRELWEVLVG
jgi:hypothetical protein